MKRKNEKITVVSNILKKIKETNKYSNYKISKITGLSEKTVKKIIENTGSNLSTKTIKKILLLKELRKDEKKELKSIISKKTKKNITEKDIQKTKKIKKDEYNYFLEEFEKLLQENRVLKAKIEILEKDNFVLKDYMQRRKEGVFATDFETRTLLITKLWDFNDTIFKKWSDFKLLLDINGKEENHKLRKGIRSVLETLKNIENYLENATFDINDYENKKEDVIILEEEEEMKLDVVLSELTEKVKKPLELLKAFYGEDEKQLLKIGILTNIAFDTLPNYKNYKDLVSGISQARMMKGVNGRNYVESQVEKLLKIYDLEDINNDIIEKAIELITLTFDSIYFKGREKTKTKFMEALEDVEFLYINLRLAVKIIGESLRNKNVELSNLTLQFITDEIKNEKSNIAEEYISAYVSGDEKQLHIARNNYRETMERMLNNFVSQLSIPYDKAMQLNKEQEIVKKIGKENLDYITVYLLGEVQREILKNQQIQLMLEF